MGQISEKTLEINFVRNFRHSHHFIWQGATLREEANAGWDVKIYNLANGSSFIVQFKRPYSVKWHGSCRKFVFYINNNSREDQNQILADLAQSLGEKNVFYAFPCVENISELASPREAILWKTALADIHQTNLTKLGAGKHKVEIEYCDNSTPLFRGLVYSEPKEIELMTVQEYKDWGFSFERLRESVRGIHKMKSKKMAIKFFTKM